MASVARSVGRASRGFTPPALAPTSRGVNPNARDVGRCYAPHPSYARLRRGHSSTASTCQSSKSNTEHALPETLQETENLAIINGLVRQIRADFHRSEHVQVTKLPSRLAPRRTWAEEARVRASDDEAPSTSAAARRQDVADVVDPKPKRMRDSYVELSLPFSSDAALLERYIATSGAIRLGKIFEDLDTLAGSVSYQHALGAQPAAGDTISPIFIVTASVDRLDLLENLVATADYIMTGQVIYVGSSSMEVLVSVEKLDQGGSKTVLTGRFTMVARNAATLQSQKIAPLLLETDAERELFKMGQDHKNRKSLDRAASLARVPPTQDEAKVLHERFLADSRKDDEEVRKNAVPVSQTWLSSTMHMHPQQRNVHMKVFGGFLMRSAYELAWMTAASFARRPVTFLALDALSFHAPVSIGAVLALSAQINYTSNAEASSSDTGSRGGNGEADGEDVIAAVSVLAEVVDIGTGRRQRSNSFQFSFSLGATHRRVSPETYREAMEWLEGRRRVELGNELRSLFREAAAAKG